MGSMTQSESIFVLENDPALIGPLVIHVQEDCTHIGLCDATEQTRLGVALEEAVTNALYHGNLQVGLRVAGAGRQGLSAAGQAAEPGVALRRSADPHHRPDEPRPGRVRHPRRGPRFRSLHPARPYRPGEPGESQRAGVFLMRTFMNEVNFNETGNCVTLVKLRDLSRPASSEEY